MWFQKISVPIPRKVYLILGIAQIFKRKYEPRLEFPEILGMLIISGTTHPIVLFYWIKFS